MSFVFESFSKLFKPDLSSLGFIRHLHPTTNGQTQTLNCDRLSVSHTGKQIEPCR